MWTLTTVVAALLAFAVPHTIQPCHAHPDVWAVGDLDVGEEQPELRLESQRNMNSVFHQVCCHSGSQLPCDHQFSQVTYEVSQFIDVSANKSALVPGLPYCARVNSAFCVRPFSGRTQAIKIVTGSRGGAGI